MEKAEQDNQPKTEEKSAGLEKKEPPNEERKSGLSALKKTGRIILVILIASLILSAIAVGSVFAYNKAYAQKIYPRTYVAYLDISGKSIAVAQDIIADELSNHYDKGYAFSYEDKTVTIKLNKTEDNGNSYSIIEFDPEATAEQAFLTGHSGDIAKDLRDQLRNLIQVNKIELRYKTNEITLKEKLKEQFSYLENPAQNAQLKITKKEAGDYEFEITPEKQGQSFDYDKALQEFEANIQNLNSNTVNMVLIPQEPKVSSEQVSELVPQVQELLSKEKIILKYEDQSWELSDDDYSNWFQVILEEDQPKLIFDHELVQGYLEFISEEIRQEPQNAKFQIEDGKVQEFSASQNGLDLDYEESYKKISEEFIIQKNSAIELVVKEVEADVTTASINDLGITELIGQADSNFAGSPPNRVHNIRNGAKILNGLLIAPGEEFSTIKSLGEITGSAGFLPELVIKGNKTIPEMGGGLCQIGTTMFRVALDAGLPISERRPHSYRVSYYEPAGTDATIYDPHPDLRFVNDTDHHLLLQTRIEGVQLIFELWGTSDGRVVEISDPKVFNITYPGPTKMIESPDLAPGQKRCTESAHNGADTVFYRTIKYPKNLDATEDFASRHQQALDNGEFSEDDDYVIKEETWSSHYKAWQAVCLIGAEAETDSGDGADSSDETADTETQAPETSSAPADSNNEGSAAAEE